MWGFSSFYVPRTEELLASQAGTGRFISQKILLVFPVYNSRWTGKILNTLEEGIFVFVDIVLLTSSVLKTFMG